MKFENVWKTYKINITDTPAIFDTGLTVEEVENEIIEATIHSLDAYLLCVPANAITKYYTTDVIYSDIFTRYFGNEFYYQTIVVFTRCDQFESENKQTFTLEHAIGKNKIFKQMKCVCVSGKDDSIQLEKVIECVQEFKNEQRKRDIQHMLSLPTYFESSRILCSLVCFGNRHKGYKYTPLQHSKFIWIATNTVF